MGLSTPIPDEQREQRGAPNGILRQGGQAAFEQPGRYLRLAARQAQTYDGHQRERMFLATRAESFCLLWSAPDETGASSGSE